MQSGRVLGYTGTMATKKNIKVLDIPLSALPSDKMPRRPYIGVYDLEMKLIASSKNKRVDDYAESITIGGRRPGWGDSIIDGDADALILEFNGEPAFIVVGAADAAAARGMGMAAIVDLL